jgi:DNA (cytosine-5)-methyltransferase 1
MARIIHEVRPRYVFVENSPMLTSRGLGRVLGDLASMGFDAKWGVLGANDIGANHQRDRIWIVAKWRGQLPHAQHDRIRWWEQQSQSFEKEIAKLANTECMGWEERPSERGELVNQETSNQSDYCGETSGEGETIANSERTRLERRKDCGKQEVTWTRGGGSPIGHASWWSTEPNVGRVAHGVAARMERIKAIGNGQVPLCAATAWRILK